MSCKLTEKELKERIKKLYEQNPNIHINLTLKRAKENLKNLPAVITGVYTHLFSVQVEDKGFPQTYSVQYAEVLINKVEILELAEPDEIENEKIKI